MQRLLLTTLLLLPFTAIAQPHFEVGVTGGVTTLTSLTHVYDAPLIKNKTAVSYNNVLGYTGGIKALIDFHICQLGLGIEGGGMGGSLHRVVGYKEEIDANLPFQLATYNYEIEEQKVAAPYVVPNLFFHFKINFSDRLYLYVGPMGGRVFSKEDLSWDGKSSGWLAGGNLGLVIKLSDRISIDIAEGWRMAWMRDANTDITNRRQWYNPKIVGQEGRLTYVALSYNTYNMSYASSSVGIRVRL